MILESSDDRPGDSHVRIVVQGCTAAPPPRPFEIRRIRTESSEAVLRDFILESDGGELRLRARSIQVHESPGLRDRTFLEPRPVPMAQRWLWKLLLAALRIPGVFALVSRIRKRRGPKM